MKECKPLNGGAIHADVEIICAPPALYLPTVSHPGLTPGVYGYRVRCPRI